MNVNKIFPRLPIRVKLIVAFAALVSLPLVATGLFGTRETLHQIESAARTTLDHELQTTGERTEHFLAGAEEDLVYLSETDLRPVAEGTVPADSARSALDEFLRLKPDFFHVRLLTPDGDPILLDPAPPPGAAEVSGGAYYAYRARALPPGRNALLAVEIRGPGAEGDGRTRAIPAFAVVHPIAGADGRPEAIAVGEFYASRLFQVIGTEHSGLGGTIGVVDADGKYLYDSQRKRDWNTLLATRPDVNLATEFGAGAARRILSGSPGTVRALGDRMVTYRPLHLAGPDGRPLYVYRAVPFSAFARPARHFLFVVGVGGFLVLGVAMGLAIVAATQFTRPIYQLREEARRLADGEFGPPPRIETNDELEDLAVEFGRMADRLRLQHRELEDLVAERTAALREAHAELEEVLAHSEDAILGLDPEGRVRIWNRGAEKMFGYGRHEALGRSLETLLGEPGSRGMSRPEAATEPVLGLRTVRWRKDGRPVEVSLSRTVIRDPGDDEVLGYTVIIRDETKSRALERQMVRSERLAAAGQLAAGIVHEINNPIGIIVTRLDCLDVDLDERPDDDRLRSDLEVIRKQTLRVGSVARRLLTLAREEPEAHRPLDLNDLIGGVIRFLQPELRKRDLRLESDLAPDLPRIRASSHGIETVLLNLLLNAMDASEPGGTIGIASRLSADGGSVVLEVTDDGSGIEPERLERIFEPFFTTKVKPRGTGLGLAVCQAVVQEHGGEIRVESAPGSGSRFTVVLPVEPKEAA